MTYGYCRVSTPSQNIERQIRNISEAYPDAVIMQDKFTGTTMIRPEWQKLLKNIKPGDTIIFDSVSRMSRSTEEGTKTYFDMLDAGITLVFLKEPQINTQTYQKAIKEAIPMTGTSVDCILEGINQFLRTLAAEQIRLAFEQAQKEIDDLHKRTSEGMLTAKLNGKQIGQQTGRKLNVKKAAPAKEIIRKHYSQFGGELTSSECIKLAGIAPGTFFKYVKEIKLDLMQEYLDAETK